MEDIDIRDGSLFSETKSWCTSGETEDIAFSNIKHTVLHNSRTVEKLSIAGETIFRMLKNSSGKRRPLLCVELACMH